MSHRKDLIEVERGADLEEPEVAGNDQNAVNCRHSLFFGGAGNPCSR